MSINECNLKGGVIIDPKCLGEKTIQTAWTDIFIKKAWAQAVAFEPGNYVDGDRYSEFAKKVNLAWRAWLRSKGYDPDDPSSVKKFGDSYIADKYDCDNFAHDFYKFLLSLGGDIKPSYAEELKKWGHAFNDAESKGGEKIYIEPQNGKILRNDVVKEGVDENDPNFTDETDATEVDDIFAKEEARETTVEKQRAEYAERQKDITPHKEWEYSKRDNKWEYVPKKFNSITDGAKDFKDKIEKETGQEFEIYYRDSAASETGAGFFYLIFKGQDPESHTPPDELMKPGADY